ncbi:MAG: YbaK/EbsC family protein [Candidatus Buchananbacteria bacterium]|nr:YbaK/EbsC family protein [Candidatus Buchananbacteria bacterium]
MSIPKKIKSYLDKQNIDYEEIAHKTVYTAYDAAQTLKKELKEIAKNLIIKADNTYALVVVPADKKLDLNKIKKALKAKKVSIPSEKVIIKVLKIKPGAVSSFGKLHKLEMLVDKAMLGTKKAVFSTGSVTDSVFIKVKDFIQMEEAKMADIAMKGGYKIPKNTKRKMIKVKKKAAAKKKSFPKKKPAKKKTAAKKKKR